MEAEQLVTRIIKYVDNTKVITKITFENDVEKLQNFMKNIYD